MDASSNSPDHSSHRSSTDKDKHPSGPTQPTVSTMPPPDNPPRPDDALSPPPDESSQPEATPDTAACTVDPVLMNADDTLPTSVSSSSNVRSPRPPLSRSRRASANPVETTAVSAVPDQQKPVDKVDNETSRLTPCLGANVPGAFHGDGYRPVPEPALTAKSSFSEVEPKRSSISSLYSLASARGIIPSSAVSATGSETGTTSRSAAGSVVASGKSTAQISSEQSNVTGVSSTISQHGSQGSLTSYHLTPRDAQLDVVKRGSGTSRNDQAYRSQPTRSRSRAKRRFSGSTAASSNSPGSDRGPHHKEKEEGQQPYTRARVDSDDLTQNSQTGALGRHRNMCPRCQSQEQTK